MVVGDDECDGDDDCGGHGDDDEDDGVHKSVEQLATIHWLFAVRCSKQENAAQSIVKDLS